MEKKESERGMLQANSISHFHSSSRIPKQHVDILTDPFAFDQCTGQERRRKSSFMVTVHNLLIFVLVLLFIIVSSFSIESMDVIDQICSRSCSNETCDRFFSIHSLPFCSKTFLNISFHRMNFTDPSHCRIFLQQLIQLDEEARTASTLFANYIQAIDAGEDENPYAKSDSDCQRAYRRWTCSVKIPYIYRSYRIAPCQTICDEVERVCPTFRPSEREPLFAGQPLFLCNGGLVVNRDYAQRPHCFDSCHLSDDPSTFTRPFVTSSSRSREGFLILPSTCFDIEPLLVTEFDPWTSFIRENITFIVHNVSPSIIIVSTSAKTFWIVLLCFSYLSL